MNLADLKYSAYRVWKRILIDRYLKVDKERYPEIQRKFLSQLLNNSRQHVPFYKKLLDGKVIDETICFEILRTLPIVDKGMIRSNNSFISDVVDPNWKYWHNTGGSTGEPLRFPTGGSGKSEVDREELCQAQLYMLMAGSYRIRISAIDGRRVNDESLSRNIYWGENELTFPYGKIHYSTMYLSDDTFQYYLNKLNEDKPEVLRGYSSGIYDLARYIRKNSSVLEFKLKGVYLTSENILDYQVELIEDVFKCKVWGQYGHSESSIFAVRKPYQADYECSPLYGVVEVLGESGEHVNVGEVGEIVVTGFQNKALPFIRYKTGDLAEYGGAENGIVRLRQLMGRTNDYIISKDGEKIFLVGFIFGGHLSAFNHIETWQIVQDIPGVLEITIIPSGSYSEETEGELKAFFSTNGFDVNLHYDGNIIKTKRGKQPFLIQNIKSN